MAEIIKGRRSVRTFDGAGVTAQDLQKLRQYAESLDNPFGVPVRIVFLDAKEYGLSSPVLAGEKLYAAGIVAESAHTDAAFGYSFEKFVLYAWSLGIGTTWIAGTMDRKQFEEAAAPGEGERMPCITPLGYPAEKKSLRESLMRRGVGADKRMPAEKLCFEDAFGKVLSEETMKAYGGLIEMVRWAPSAVNKQPWRLVFCDGAVHFYEKKDSGFVSEATGDLQKIDVGIALYHFAAGLAEQGRQSVISVNDPGIACPDNTEYVASILIE